MNMGQQHQGGYDNGMNQHAVPGAPGAGAPGYGTGGYANNRSWAESNMHGLYEQYAYGVTGPGHGMSGGQSQGQGKQPRGPSKKDSRYDKRYSDTVSYDGSFHTQAHSAAIEARGREMLTSDGDDESYLTLDTDMHSIATDATGVTGATGIISQARGGGGR